MIRPNVTRLIVMSATLGACAPTTQAVHLSRIEHRISDARSNVDPDAALEAVTTKQRLDKAALVRAVLTRNPNIKAAHAAWRSALARYQQRDAVPDPVLSYSFAPGSIFDPEVRSTTNWSASSRRASRRASPPARRPSMIRFRRRSTAPTCFTNAWSSRPSNGSLEHNSSTVGQKARSEVAITTQTASDRNLQCRFRLGGGGGARRAARLRRSAAERKSIAASIDLAQRDYAPDFTIFGSYNSMWSQVSHQFMFGISAPLPVVVARRAGRETAERARLRENESRQQSQNDSIRAEVYEAQARLAEARHVATLYVDRLIPLATKQALAARPPTPPETLHSSTCSMLSAGFGRCDVSGTKRSR